MRLVGNLSGQKQVEQFVAYLLTQKIRTHVETADESPDSFEIWVRDEDRVNDARTELEAFRSAPEDPKYGQALRAAQDILKDERRERTLAAKNQRSLRPTGSRFSGGGRIPPLTLTLIVLCSAVSLINNFGNPGKNNSLGQTISQELKFVNLNDFAASDKDPAVNLKQGELWRVITPIFMHGDPFHLLLNMLMLLQLGRVLERIEGTPRFAFIILVTAIASSLLQGLMPEKWMGNPNFVGISGVVYGLFGYIWVKSTLRPEMGIMLPPFVVILLIGWLVLGFATSNSDVPVMSNIANLCHLGGLLSGMGLGYLAATMFHKVK